MIESVEYKEDLIKIAKKLENHLNLILKAKMENLRKHISNI